MTSMPAPAFRPGFRCFLIDGIVLVAGAVAVVVIGPTAGWISFVIGFVVAHFFLFCNVFRIARSLELAWSGLFISLSYGTLAFGWPTWMVTIAMTLLTTIVVIALEMRKPSYHGIAWQLINPRLREWWEREGGGSLV